AGLGAARGRHLLRAFRHANYRLFFAGQLVSLVGTFLSQVAIAWVVYSVYHSPAALGVVLFCGQIPLLVVSPFAGVFADRVNRQRLLVVTQALSALQSAALGYLAFTGGLDLTAVALLALAQGLINAFDMPARQAFLTEMVTDPADLPNAIALNSTMVHAARLVGPAAGGLLLAAVGAGWCFSIDAASYVAVIGSLLLMRVTPRTRKPSGKGVLHDLYEGLAYAWGNRPMRALLLLMATLSLAGMPALSTLVPVFAEHFAGGDDRAGSAVLGFLMAASGAGALCGAVQLAGRRSVVGLGGVICLASVAFGAGLVAFSFAQTLWVGLLVIPVCGWAMLMNFASANTLLQTLSDEDKRGRVMSLFTIAFLGVAPLGNLLAGRIAGWVSQAHGGGQAGNLSGAAITLRLCGGVCVAAGLVFLAKLPALRRAVRPVYERMGIIPPREVRPLATSGEGP
ncbi:MAG TPA: MFS transporter, partial [Humisphaera sp.]